MSITSYNGFTLAQIGNYSGTRESLSANTNKSVFNRFLFDAEDFSRYVFYSLATDRVDFHINKVLTTYPIGLGGIDVTSVTASFETYLNYLNWKSNAHFTDLYVLKLMSATGNISGWAYTNSMNTTLTSVEWVRRTNNNDLYGSTISSVTGFQYSASSYDELIIEDITA